MIKITAGNSTQTVEQFTFSAGEVQVRIDPTVDYFVDNITVHASIKSSDAVMALIMTMDALRYHTTGETKFHLVMPYLPYARQDRRCQAGEALASRAMINMINSLNFTSVGVWDVHNTAVLDWFTCRVTNVAQHEFARTVCLAYDVVCAPDKGAVPKLKEYKLFKQLNIAIANKVRDPSTGQITHTEILSTDVPLKGKEVLIVDDICDGGRTFIELAKVLRAEGVETIGLYVTHGIFSKGVEVFDGLIDDIYTTRSFYTGNDDRVEIVG